MFRKTYLCKCFINCSCILLHISRCSLVECLEAASLHPAQALGIDKTKVGIRSDFHKKTDYSSLTLNV